MYRVIGTVIYTIIDNYICLDYISLLQYNNLTKNDIRCENTELNNLSGLGISDILMDIM